MGNGNGTSEVTEDSAYFAECWIAWCLLEEESKLMFLQMLYYDNPRMYEKVVPEIPKKIKDKVPT